MPVFHGGHLYGYSGREDRHNGSFRCVEAATGEMKWEQADQPVGHVLLVRDRLLLSSHDGTLQVIAECESDQFDTHLKLYDDDGVRNNALMAADIDRTGRYTLWVSSNGGNSGDYELRVPDAK